jgi:hypothetical protein
MCKNDGFVDCMYKPTRVNLNFGDSTVAKLDTVMEMLGGFENYGQVCRYLINRGLEGISAQIGLYETQKHVREVVSKSGTDNQELMDFMRAELEKQERTLKP